MSGKFRTSKKTYFASSDDFEDDAPMFEQYDEMYDDVEDTYEEEMDYGAGHFRSEIKDEHKPIIGEMRCEYRIGVKEQLTKTFDELTFGIALPEIKEQFSEELSDAFLDRVYGENCVKLLKCQTVLLEPRTPAIHCKKH